MKIFVMADVHGFYDEMKYALDQAGLIQKMTITY